MKTLKIFAVVAIAIAAAGSSYAFNTPQKTGQATQQWYVNSSGQPTSPVDSDHPCENDSSPVCSKEFNIVNGQPTTPTGNFILNGPRS